MPSKEFFFYNSRFRFIDKPPGRDMVTGAGGRTGGQVAVRVGSAGRRARASARVPHGASGVAGPAVCYSGVGDVAQHGWLASPFSVMG